MNELSGFAKFVSTIFFLIFLVTIIHPGWVVSLFLLYVFLFHYEKALFLWSQIQKLFLWIGPKFRKKQIENQVKSNVLKVSKEISKEIEEVIPYDLKIEWVKESDRQAFFDGNTVVVCMDNKRNEMHTTVHIINDYVANGLLANEKSLIDEKVHKSSCLVLTRKLLLLSYKKSMSYFFEEILEKEIENDDEIKEGVDKLISLDENGLFTQVLLRELKAKSIRFLGRTRPKLFNQETKRFINFLYQLAIRKTGDDTTVLDFRGNYYKVGIILVAKAETYLDHGEDSYVNRFRQKVLNGMNSIYLCARNDKVEIAENVSNKIKNIVSIGNFEITSRKIFKYTGRTESGLFYPGICIHISLERIKKQKKNTA